MFVRVQNVDNVAICDLIIFQFICHSHLLIDCDVLKIYFHWVDEVDADRPI